MKLCSPHIVLNARAKNTRWFKIECKGPTYYILKLSNVSRVVITVSLLPLRFIVKMIPLSSGLGKIYSRDGA